MIGSLRGKILEIQAPDILIEVNGIGYEVAMPMTSIYELPSVGSEAFIYTHLSVREDAHSLYGFTTKEAKLLYRELVKINGVGPKLALAVLSAYTPDQFVMAIKKENLAQIVKIPGVGKKTAERIVLELSNSFDTLPLLEPDFGFTPKTQVLDEAIDVLVSMGLVRFEATRVVKDVATPSDTTEDIIKKALKYMNK